MSTKTFFFFVGKVIFVGLIFVVLVLLEILVIKSQIIYPQIESAKEKEIHLNGDSVVVSVLSSTQPVTLTAISNSTEFDLKVKSRNGVNYLSSVKKDGENQVVLICEPNSRYSVKGDNVQLNLWSLDRFILKTDNSTNAKIANLIFLLGIATGLYFLVKSQIKILKERVHQDRSKSNKKVKGGNYHVKK